ncbi:hypothetical protein MWU54_11685 [Marivita sp. S6314]|uniref:hypothetical protein n=1 Tax=Marivita sp. S6314 TaxID=2926406 RepID=UPI001FF6A5C7|nr:hypothetical protein [Marivita sp. S6314]MCK0150689.1 hypothetical protein [Marivita sp. S6314]
MTSHANGMFVCITVLLAAGPVAAQDNDVVAAMIAEGAPAAMANCMVEQLGDDAERLFTASDDELTEADTETLMAALEACSDVDAGE